MDRLVFGAQNSQDFPTNRRVGRGRKFQYDGFPYLQRQQANDLFRSRSNAEEQ